MIQIGLSYDIPDKLGMGYRIGDKTATLSVKNTEGDHHIATAKLTEEELTSLLNAVREILTKFPTDP